MCPDENFIAKDPRRAGAGGALTSNPGRSSSFDSVGTFSGFSTRLPGSAVKYGMTFRY